MNTVLANQTKIDQLLSKIYKDEQGGNVREEKKLHLKQWKEEEGKVKMNF